MRGRHRIRFCAQKILWAEGEGGEKCWLVLVDPNFRASMIFTTCVGPSKRLGWLPFRSVFNGTSIRAKFRVALPSERVPGFPDPKIRVLHVGAS